MKKVKGERRYISYLLRLWQVKSGGQAIWRASLQDPPTGHRWGFATLADCFDFLEAEMQGVAQDRAGLVEIDEKEAEQ